MNWVILSVVIAFSAIMIILVSKKLKYASSLNPKQIAVTSMLTAAIISVVFLRKYLRFKLDQTQALITMRALASLTMVYLTQLAAHQSINYGLISAVAYALYLPVLSFILYFWLGETLTKIKIIGMAFGLFGIFLMLK